MYTCVCSTLGTPLGLYPGPLGFMGLPVNIWQGVEPCSGAGGVLGGH